MYLRFYNFKTDFLKINKINMFIPLIYIIKNFCLLRKLWIPTPLRADLEKEPFQQYIKFYVNKTTASMPWKKSEYYHFPKKKFLIV